MPISDLSSNIHTIVSIVLGLVLGKWYSSKINNRMQGVWRKSLQAWALKHGYQVLDAEFQKWHKGPFTWGTLIGQAVYYVVLSDQNGGRRQAWIRVSNLFTENVDSNIEIQWDNKGDEKGVKP